MVAKGRVLRPELQPAPIKKASQPKPGRLSNESRAGWARVRSEHELQSPLDHARRPQVEHARASTNRV